MEAITIYLQRVATYNPLVVATQLVLIGIVVWLVMRFLRGTRGAGLVKGAALLLAAVFIFIRLLPKTDEWKRIEFLYGNFLLFAFMAFVVAFQPELRRALISIGQARLFRNRHVEIEDMVDEIIHSLGFLSRNKIGAIVAMERSVGLGALIESGVQIDAEVTSDLLSTIFYPGSAMHDLGVIIHNQRVAAAGCQFPIAESEEVDASLGSRHRAALGLSNDSDAVVLVVSEETGRISLACEGQLYIGLDITGVRDMLLDLLAPGRARPRRGQVSSAKGGAA
ncbi:MAG: TIGR00159 family protein [Planctomycetota bacterium]|nr:MAG: TIGR00159 family protein [Planctomycetota bacterium]